MARPRHKRPKRRRDNHQRHGLARTVTAGDAAGPEDAWECECGSRVVHWIDSIEVQSTLVCVAAGVAVSEIAQTVPPQRPAVLNQTNVVSNECGLHEHGHQTHNHHIALVETLHGSLVTHHPNREAAIAWLHAQGLDYEDEDPNGEDLHDGNTPLYRNR